MKILFKQQTYTLDGLVGELHRLQSRLDEVQGALDCALGEDIKLNASDEYHRGYSRQYTQEESWAS